MRRPAARLTLCGVVLVAFTTAAPGAMAFAASAELPGRVLEVAVQSGRLSVRAHQARLADVLEAVGRKAGVRIVLHGDLDAPVTASFADLPVDAGVQRLSRPHSVVLIYTPSPGRVDGPVLAEVWVTGFSGGSGRAAPATESVQRNDSRAGASRPLVPSGLTPDARSPLTHRNPAVRVRAIQALVREEEPVALGTLREFATRDPAPAVRLAAIRMLSKMDSAEAGDALRATLGDHDPAIRAAANQAFGRWQHRPRRPVDSDD